MVLGKIRSKLKMTVDELDEHRLKTRYQTDTATAIAAAPLRQTICLAGEVKETRVVPRAGAPSLEVTIGDGSGRAIVVFTGRKMLPGLKLGGSIAVEGVGRLERNRLTLLNPAYTLS